jgi:uncharacterized protein (TIRG00374 family)
MNNLDEQKDIIETQLELEQVPKKKERKKMNRTLKYFLNIVIILLITTLYAWLTLKDSHEEVLAALTSPNADYRFIALIIGFILLYFAVDGLILFIFARLYTTTYKLHRGIANAFIGQFYSNITPGASGGQFAQAVTFKKQGVDVSTGASILVMHYILYQIVLMIFGFVSIVFNFNTFMRGAPIVILDVEIPVWILTGLGYLLNAIVIVGLFLLAYSKKIHSWTINTGVNIGAKLKLIRNPEEKRKKLMLSTENFRIELRRLQSNIPASLLIMFLFVVRFFLLYSIPYFVIVMLDPSFTTQPIYLQTVVSNSFLQMVTGLFPLPGAAGFTEYFFERLFLPILGGSDNIAFVKAVQIVWRLSTFYVGLISGGLVAAFYRSSMERTLEEEQQQTFADLQTATLAIRTVTSDTAYTTSSLSVTEIKRKLEASKSRRRIKKTAKMERKKQKEDEK